MRRSASAIARSLKCRLCFLCSALCLLCSVPAFPQASKWWAHVEALANDGMEGRNTGSPAHQRAADYVAAEFKAAGLEPAGTNGYIQPVAFKTRRLIEAQSSLMLVRDGKTQPLILGEDANI